jgi:hypothetical protein
MSLPSCVIHAEIEYRTKMCNGKLLYEITDQYFNIVSGSCSFATCIYSELHKDVEKEMILNVFGSTNVISSKPSSCYKLLELDGFADPDFLDCASQHGAVPVTQNPFGGMYCSTQCCVAEAVVKYDQRGRPIVFWQPLQQSVCDDPFPRPDSLTIKICCSYILLNGESVCNDERTFTLKVIGEGKCTAYCGSSMFFKEASLTSIDENKNVIQDNINFLRGTKIYPNPSHDNFNLRLVLPSNQAVLMEILDVKGQVVRKQNIQFQTLKQEYTIETTDLKDGFYFCRITTELYGSKVIKISKQ